METRCKLNYCGCGCNTVSVYICSDRRLLRYVKEDGGVVRVTQYSRVSYHAIMWLSDSVSVVAAPQTLSTCRYTATTTSLHLDFSSAQQSSAMRADIPPRPLFILSLKLSHQKTILLFYISKGNHLRDPEKNVGFTTRF